MPQQTAVDWLLENLPERFKNAMLNTCQEEIKQAREKHKVQVINSFDMGRDETTHKFVEDGDDYYTKAYGNQ